MTFTKITAAGAGTMGSQVAWQMAFHGKHVIVYDAIPAGLEKGKAFHREYAEHFITAARRHPDADRRHLRSPHLHHRPGGGGARRRLSADCRYRAAVSRRSGPRGARSVTVSPTFAVSSALASGERHDTRASPESSSSTPTMVTSRSRPLS